MPFVDRHNCPWNTEAKVDVGGIASSKRADSCVSFWEPVVSVSDRFSFRRSVVGVLTSVNRSGSLPAGENVGD